MKITANDIHKGLVHFVRGSQSDVIIPNYYLGHWEMDVFKVTPSGYVTEYEIKVSRSDFKADFEKLNSYRKDTGIKKHDKIKSGKHDANRFFFVVPFQMILPDEVPDHCGLIYYRHIEKWTPLQSNAVYTIVKNAPLLHKRKFADYHWRGIAVNLMWRYIELKRRNAFEKKGKSNNRLTGL